MSVGKRIREVRDNLGMSQVDFANAIGVTKQTLYKYENDLITNIPSDKVELAAKVGGVTPGYLMGWEDVEETQQHRYYTDDETAKIAQEIFDDSYLHALFRAARRSKHEDVQMVTEMLNRFKGTNPDG